MEVWTELRDDDGGNAKGNFWFNLDLDFPFEKYCFDPCKERLRSLFDQLLVAFMKEKSSCNCIRPIPPLCGDAQPVDLFKLFWVVRKIGGHDAVSRNNLWDFVSEECGFGIGVIPNIRLIHMKYLKELDQWLRQDISKRILEHENGGLVQKLDLLSRELEARFTKFSSDEQQEEHSKFLKDISENELHLSSNGGISENLLSGNGHSAEHIICELNQVCVDIDENISDFTAPAKRVVKNAAKKFMNGLNGFSKGQGNDDSGKSCDGDDGNIMASAKKVIEKVINKVLICEGTVAAATDNGDKLSVEDNIKVVKNAISRTLDLSENIIDDEDRVSVQQGISNVIPAKSDVGKVLDSRKRKRQSQSFLGMLNWLIHVAKHPNDPSVGKIPECSKWIDYGNEEFWVQAMLAREALLIRRHATTNAGESVFKDKQKKPMMHPSMYQDDVLDHQSAEKLRCSKRVPTSTKSQLCPCCNLNAAQSKNTVHQESNKRNSPKAPMKLVLKDVDELPKNSKDPKSSDMPAERQVAVGPLFQAQVPEWTGVISESDPKWLGTKMWPPKDGERYSITTRLDPVGKGRQHPCDCPFPNSVECLRFHVAEKRLKLKCELGSMFYRWRFDRMGEEVSLSWTEEEENGFKDMMRSYAAFPDKFWNNAPRSLPSKTREKLVSYYFNVFLVHRRSYQNRVTPKDVDSDDDEKECGSIGGYFGYKALYVPRSSFVSCTLNKESYELL